MPPDPPLPSPAPDPDLLRAFLKDRDAHCPHCRYNLRGVAIDRCPECGQPLSLILDARDPRTGWDILALIAVVLTTLYFAVRAATQVLMLLGGVYRGTPFAPVRLDMAITAVVDAAMALLGLWWLTMILRHRTRHPRPIWSRPTTAAAGLLLAVFVAFLLAYGVRSVG